MQRLSEMNFTYWVTGIIEFLSLSGMKEDWWMCPPDNDGCVWMFLSSPICILAINIPYTYYTWVNLN